MFEGAEFEHVAGLGGNGSSALYVGKPFENERLAQVGLLKTIALQLGLAFSR